MHKVSYIDNFCETKINEVIKKIRLISEISVPETR